MTFLLDTDTCSHLMRGNSRVFSRSIQYGGLCISTVTLAELSVWAWRAERPRHNSLADLLAGVDVLPLTAEVAETYGRTLAAMLDAGRPGPKHDMLIAATALHHDLTLVTHNGRDFANVPDLRVVD